MPAWFARNSRRGRLKPEQPWECNSPRRHQVLFGMRWIELNVPLGSRETWIHVNGNNCIRPENAAQARFHEIVLLRLNTHADHPEHSTVREIEAPVLPDPEWNVERCVEQWREHAKARWVREWVLAEAGSKHLAVLMLEALNRRAS